MPADGAAGDMFIKMMCGELAGNAGQVANESIVPMPKTVDREQMINDFAKSTYTKVQTMPNPSVFTGSARLPETKKEVRIEVKRDFTREAMDESEKTLAKLLKIL